jgi:hypothetical protein
LIESVSCSGALGSVGVFPLKKREREFGVPLKNGFWEARFPTNERCYDDSSHYERREETRMKI